MSAPVPATAPATSAREPWLGLESYRQEHRELFFGRSRETEELLRMIRREALTVVFGPSGTGKTSLLNAAVFPKLEKEAFLPVYVRLDHTPGSPAPGRQIRARIDQAIRQQGIDEASLVEGDNPEPANPDQEPIWEYLHRVEFWNRQNEPVTPVLFFDQFEEAFTLGAGRAETSAFFAEMGDLVENYTPASVRNHLDRTGAGLPYPQLRRYKVVVSLREDFVHKLDGLRKLMPSIMQNRFPLTRMDGSQAMEAVLKPGGTLVSEEVAGEIVRFVAGAQSANQARDSGVESELKDLEVEPALLSVVCRELNLRRRAAGSAAITAEQVRAASSDVLKDFYERSFEGIPPEARYFVEDRLLTGSGFRSTAPEEDALKQGVSLEVIRILEDRRLIRREQRLRIAHIELTHDLLTRVVRESRDARRERGRLDEERRAQKEREAKLEQERQAQEAKLRSARRQSRLMLMAAAVCLALGVVALYFMLGARSLKLEAETNLALLYEERAGTALANGDNQLAWLYTLEALDKGLDGKHSLHVSLSRLLLPWMRPGPHTRDLYSTDTAVWSVAFSPDGKYVAAGTAEAATGELNAQIYLWGPGEAEDANWPHEPGGDVWQIAFSPDGKTLATASSPGSDSDGSIELWDVASRESRCAIQPENRSPKRMTRNGEEQEPLSVGAVTFSSKGDMIASGASDGVVQFWSTECKALSDPMREGPAEAAEAVNSVAFRSDGLVLAAAAGSSIQLWDVRSRKSSTLAPPPGSTTPAGGSSADSNAVRTLAFSPARNLLAAGYDDNRLCWWNLDMSDREPTCPEGHQGAVLGVSFSPDLKTLASGSYDNSLRLWDVETGKMLALIDNYEAVNSVAFSADGQELIFGTSEGTVDRLTFSARTFDSKETSSLLDLLRNPLAEQSRATLRQWHDVSIASLGYRLENSEFLPTSADAVAKANNEYFSDPDVHEAPVFGKDDVDLFSNSVNKGYSHWEADELLLVPDKKKSAAQAVFLKRDLPPPFVVEFEYSIKNEEGYYTGAWENLPADGLVLMFLKDKSPYRTKAPPDGGARAFLDDSGYGIHFKIFDGEDIFLADSKGKPLATLPSSLAYRIPDVYTDGEWRKVRVTVTRTSVIVAYDGYVVIQWTGIVSTRFKGMGFGAANGAADADHRIRNVKINASENIHSDSFQSGSR